MQIVSKLWNWFYLGLSTLKSIVNLLNYWLSFTLTLPFTLTIKNLKLTKNSYVHYTWLFKYILVQILKLNIYLHEKGKNKRRESIRESKEEKKKKNLLYKSKYLQKIVFFCFFVGVFSLFLFHGENTLLFSY